MWALPAGHESRASAPALPQKLTLDSSVTENHTFRKDKKQHLEHVNYYNRGTALEMAEGPPRCPYARSVTQASFLTGRGGGEACVRLRRNAPYLRRTAPQSEEKCSPSEEMRSLDWAPMPSRLPLEHAAKAAAAALAGVAGRLSQGL